MKKKTSAAENCIAANAECEAVFPASAFFGKRHGKNLPNEAGQALPEGSKLLQYTGFQYFSVETEKKKNRLAMKRKETKIGAWIEHMQDYEKM